MNTLPISQVRAKLPQLVDQAFDLTKATYITVQGKVKAALVNAREYELMQETINVLSDPDAMEAIKQGEAELSRDHLIDWEDIKNELNL